jgi:hypothetical protein
VIFGGVAVYSEWQSGDVECILMLSNFERILSDFIVLSGSE